MKPQKAIEPAGTNPRLPIFRGVCPAKELTAAAHRRAHQARYLAQWRALSPAEALVEAERSFGRLLYGMAALFILACLGVALGCVGTAHRPRTDYKAEKAAPSKTTTAGHGLNNGAWSYE